MTGSTNARAATPPAPTSGGGGGGAIQSVGLATAGASGVCIVSWEE
ncbi:MAG: hypothetical protein Q4G62_01620 [Pseudomonadota bacterium]|nr:hypothetical protein [Pseudomonadota bacterium]